MFKDEIEQKIKEEMKDITFDKVSFHINQDKDIYVMCNTDNFRFIYEGKYVLVQWIKGKSYYHKINKNKALDDAYKFALETISN